MFVFAEFAGAVLGLAALRLLFPVGPPISR
jgi:hypothetical protein